MFTPKDHGHVRVRVPVGVEPAPLDFLGVTFGLVLNDAIFLSALKLLF